MIYLGVDIGGTGIKVGAVTPEGNILCKESGPTQASLGYEVLAKSGASEFMSVLGSFTATFAVVLPSFIIVLLLCKVYEKWKNHYMFKGVMSGLKPATLGLIGTAALSLATPENFIDWKSFVICIVAFVALYLKKVGPFAIIGIGALVGLLIY